jgi:hypothetical protein
MKAFISYSFSESDEELVRDFKAFLVALGMHCTDGDKPETKAVSLKVRKRIRESDIFIGILSRWRKLEGLNEWATSPWLIEEKTYALSQSKKALLLVENGVSQFGGMQGELEYIGFDRTKLHKCFIRIAECLGVCVGQGRKRN